MTDIKDASVWLTDLVVEISEVKTTIDELVKFKQEKLDSFKNELKTHTTEVYLK